MTRDNEPNEWLREFKHKLKHEWKRTNHEGKDFYVPSAISNWMADGNPVHAACLLDNVQHRGRFGEIQASQLLKPRPTFVLVFAVLLSLDYGYLMYIFHKHNITDSRIDQPEPIDIKNSYLARDLRNEKVDPVKVLSEFEERRWAFNPVPLSYKIGRSLQGSRWILPFNNLKRIAIGGTAKVYQVLVEKDLLTSDFRERVREASQVVESLKGFYEFAIKEYSQEHETDYKRELQAFMAIRGQEGMVQYLGHYEHTKDEAEGPRTTYNILLEFGEFDLAEYFEHHETYPPVLPQEILLFWKDFFKVADAISRVHNLPFTTDGGEKMMYNGLHADIKPANILRVYGEFKLADFGFAKFWKLGEEARFDGGTPMYGAPETFHSGLLSKESPPITQTIDTWSLGCVISFTATWIVLGWQGILQYEMIRKSAGRNRSKDRDLPWHGAFHDGNSMLPEVKQWHQLLRASMRRSDPITDSILDIVENEMLLSEPHKRIEVEDLCQKLTHLFTEAERVAKDTEVPLSQDMKQKLLHFDQEAKPSTDLVTDLSATTPQPGDYIGAESKHGGRNVIPDVPGSRGKSTRFTKPKSIKLGKVAYRNEALSRALNVAPASNGEGKAVTTSRRTLTSSGASSLESTPSVLSRSPPHTPGSYTLQAPGRIGQPSTGRVKWRTPNQINKISTTEADSESTPAARATPSTPDRPRITKSGSPISLPDSPEQPTSGNGLVGRSRIVADPESSFTNPLNIQGFSPSGSSSIGPNPLATPRTGPCVVVTSPSSVPSPTMQGVRPCPSHSPYDYRKEDKASFAICKVRSELEEMKKKKSFWQKLPKDQVLKKVIEHRDIMFVVDRSAAMRSCWSWATYLVETLAMKLARLDEDGLDLVFTSGADFNLLGCKAPSELKSRMDRAKRELDSMGTDMAGCLSSIFSTYRQNQKYARRALTLIVLTDGMWSVSASKERGNKVEETIVDFVNELMKISQDVQAKVKYRRWFSIQFVSFATDPTAHANLKHFDSVMWKEREIPDVIDTKPWDHSNVSNLILGSFRDGADDSDEDDPVAVTSSTSTG